jgi:hypothetical protein
MPAPTATPAPCPAAAAVARRTAILAALAAGGGLWPLLPFNALCALCALPRRTATPEPLCDACRRLRADHGDALADLHPAALTAGDWALLRALRAFKDAPAGVTADGPRARELAAVLSAFLEVRVGPAGLTPAERGRLLVTAVPSAHPAVPALLERARREGWWTPRLLRVARVRAGTPRQRRRRRAERLRIADKWIVDAAAVTGRDIVVIDDVCTTGATVHSFAAALRDAGAASVRAVVLARHVGPDGHWIFPLLRARHAVGVRWRPHTPKPDTSTTPPAGWTATADARTPKPEAVA